MKPCGVDFEAEGLVSGGVRIPLAVGFYCEMSSKVRR
jgi:hypothetical protein